MSQELGRIKKLSVSGIVNTYRVAKVWIETIRELGDSGGNLIEVYWLLPSVPLDDKHRAAACGTSYSKTSNSTCQSIRLDVHNKLLPHCVQRSQQQNAKHGVMLRSLFKTQCCIRLVTPLVILAAEAWSWSPRQIVMVAAAVRKSPRTRWAEVWGATRLPI